MTFELAFAVATGFISFVAALVRAARVIEEAQMRMNHLQTQKKVQAMRIRKVGKQLLALRRERKAAEARREAMREEAAKAEKILRETFRIDRRLYVLDDRKTSNDRTWIVTVQHPDYLKSVSSRVSEDVAENWRQGRRFIVWALDKRKATEKIELRHPSPDGFRIVQIEECAPSV